MDSILGKGVYGQVVRQGRYAYKISTVGDIREDIGGWSACAREIHSVGLSHANICKRFNYRCKGMRILIKMEMGVPLDVVTADPFQVLTCIAAGLQYMHAHGILHRDVKPSNIIRVRNTYKLIDFGLSRPMCKGTDYLTGYTITRYWRPPEMLENDEDSIYTGKCDVWSLGVVYYQCLHKVLPFKGNTPSILHAIEEFKPVGVLRHLLVHVDKRFTSAQLMKWLKRPLYKRRVRFTSTCKRYKTPPVPAPVRQVMDQYNFQTKKEMEAVMILACLVCGYEENAAQLVDLAKQQNISLERIFKRLGNVKRIK